MHGPSKQGKKMNNLIALNQLIENKELALSVYNDIPETAMYMRMNQNYGMYYMYQGAENQGGRPKNPVLRYLRYLDNWVVLNSMQGNWDQFCAVNGVFCVVEFKLALAKKYPIDVLGVSKAWDIVDSKPSSSSHYNAVSGKYHRIGANDYSEFLVLHGNTEHWRGSAHRNDDLGDSFIDLERLLIELQQNAIYLNSAI